MHPHIDRLFDPAVLASNGEGFLGGGRSTISRVLSAETEVCHNRVPLSRLAGHLASHSESHAPAAVPPAYGRILSGRRPAGNTNGAFLAISNILRIAGFATYGQVILGIVGQERGWNQVGLEVTVNRQFHVQYSCEAIDMVESHRQNRDISLPLLSTPEDPHVRTNQGGSEEWTHSSSHGKYSKWVAFPFRRILHALLAVIALIALGFAMYGSFIGFHAYRKLVFPHRAVHASPATVKDGSRVVKPYFAPEVKGGVQSGTLLVKIWFKDGEKDKSLPAFDESRETDWEDMWRRERQIMSMANIGETGYVDDTLLGTKGQGRWVEQYATEISIKDIERTEDMVARVTLPGETM